MSEENKHGRIVEKGKPLPLTTRTLILKLHAEGLSYGKICAKTGVAKSTCHKLVEHFASSDGSVGPKERKKMSPTKLTPDVLLFIEYEIEKKPSIYYKEIRQKLLRNNVCTPANLPSVSLICRAVKNFFGMTYKKLQKIPKETITPEHERSVGQFFAKLLQYRPCQLHFFDEASVVRTSGNRIYGHAERGKPAVEVQRYASNATLTINLCCGYFGIDYYDILDGPSNANELLRFFDMALQETDGYGNLVFSRGHCIIMDNCGFHHHRLGERVLRTICNAHGVELLFLPTYSPELNVAEYIFRLMRHKLQRNSVFSFEFTELAVVNALNSIQHSFLPNLFRKCGYI